MKIQWQMSGRTALNLVLWTYIFVVTTEGLNVTAHHRRRRSVDDNELDADFLQVQFYHEDQIEVVILKEVIDTTLASTLLRIRYARDQHVVTDEQPLYNDPLDGPIFYHGVNSFSALTYFPHTKTLHGVLNQKFSVDSLPLVNADDPFIATAFIKDISKASSQPRNTIYPHNFPQVIRQKRMTNKRKHNEDPDSPPNKKMKVAEEKRILYPEIFLIVDVPLNQIDTQSDNKYEKATRYVLSYWNAVDMLFRTMKSVDVRINIAGILFGPSENFVDTIVPHREHVRRHNGQIFLWSSKAVDDLGSYFYYNDMIKRDSFDFLIWMTSATLINGDVWHGTNREFDHIRKVYTTVAEPGDCGGMHYEERRTQKRSNRAVVMYDDHFSQYHIAARGLAQLMFVATDDIEIETGRHRSNCLPTDPITQSSGIMDPSNRKLEGYLLWSICSETHIAEYSRTPSSCCLLNYPSRTMGVSESPKLLPISVQCACYGMQRYSRKAYARDICNKLLVCKDENGFATPVGKPLDGSPCVPYGETHRSFCNHNDCV